MEYTIKFKLQLNMFIKAHWLNRWALFFDKNRRKIDMNNKEKKDILENNYLLDLSNIKETIRINRNKAMVVVNSAMIMTYYEIGTIINKRKTWGSKYIERLSKDLSEYGSGYTTRNLKFMSQFSKEFSENEIRKQLVSQIPWGTIIVIMQKSKSHEEK